MGHLMFVHMHLQFVSQKSQNTCFIKCVVVLCWVFCVLLNLLGHRVTCMTKRALRQRLAALEAKGESVHPNLTCREIKSQTCV